MMAACACGGPLTVWLDWPEVPLANALRVPGDPPAPRQDLTLGRCHVCGTTALLTPVPPNRVFPRVGYPYRSGVAAPFQVHAAELAAHVHHLSPEGRVLDVGGNDGTLRDQFRVWGRVAAVVDPCTPEADVRGFFPAATQDDPDASVAAITALNVFAHIPDPQAFADEVARLLMPGGTFVIEVLWVSDVLAQGALDTLYHEHTWHWSLAGLMTMMRRAGLDTTSVRHLPVQGGSVRLSGMKPYRSVRRDRPAPARAHWDEDHLKDAETYRVALATWATRIDRLKQTLARGRWAGYAATAKSTLVAYAADVGPKDLAYVIDDGPQKQGRLMPYDVPIVSMDRLRDDPVDGVVLFAASYAPELRRNLLAAGFTGSVVVA